MIEEKILILDINDIKEILSKYFNVSESNIKLETYRNTNDFGDVDEGLSCEIRGYDYEGRKKVNYLLPKGSRLLFLAS